jgi:riboflavin biosynthesis pyrimidine reductase
MSVAFRRLLPEPPAEGLSAAEVAASFPPAAPHPDGRPWVALNMIATVDGRATIDGRTAPIANPADTALFHALRARADAVLVGAGTVRAERYGPMDQVAVVMTRSGDLPADVGMLSVATNRVVVLTPSPDAEVPPCAASVSYLREADPAAGLCRLAAEHGVRSVVCEGGPDLNATLLPAGLVDELQLVIAARLAGGPHPLTILSGESRRPPRDLELLSVHESGGYLFLRYATGRR